MKIKKTALDVDFIGGQNALTAADEKALSEFFKQRKISSSKTHIKQSQSSSKRQKALA
jgi:hypothetical protein